MLAETPLWAIVLGILQFLALIILVAIVIRKGQKDGDVNSGPSPRVDDQKTTESRPLQDSEDRIAGSGSSDSGRPTVGPDAGKAMASASERGTRANSSGDEPTSPETEGAISNSLRYLQMRERYWGLWLPCDCPTDGVVVLCSSTCLRKPDLTESFIELVPQITEVMKQCIKDADSETLFHIVSDMSCYTVLPYVLAHMFAGAPELPRGFCLVLLKNLEIEDAQDVASEVKSLSVSARVLGIKGAANLIKHILSLAKISNHKSYSHPLSIASMMRSPVVAKDVLRNYADRLRHEVKRYQYAAS